MNKVILVGRLTADPELRQTQSGISSCRFTVAVDRGFADKATGDDGIYYDAFISHPEADTYGQVECVLPPEIATIIKEAMANIVPNEINNTGELDTTIATLEQQANGMWETLVE